MARQIRRHEKSEPVARHRGDERPENDMNERGPVFEAPQDGQKGWRVTYVYARVVLAAWRLAQRQPLKQSEHDAGEADDQKRRAPAPGKCDVPARRAT